MTAEYKTAKGNAKLGKNCLVSSRPVGDTCPDSCHYLDNGCYAQATEKRFPNARLAGFVNVNDALANGIWTTIRMAIDSGVSIRIHERGDFMRTTASGKKAFDKKYLNAWLTSLAKFSPDELPPIWLYTHILNWADILKLEDFGVKVYASVNGDAEYKLAVKTGFKLFAFCTKVKKKKGGSIDYPARTPDNESGDNCLVCPEQRLGRLKVTCTGGKGKNDKSLACNWCVMGRGNIVFLEH